MGLNLGKSLNRCYQLRLPFLDGFYNINVFFNKKSTFLLFSIEPSFRESINFSYGAKINMFKNLQSSKFCETFLKINNYRGIKLDIVNQFESVKSEYISDINFIFNESISLAKIDIDDKTFYDKLLIYGLTLESYSNEFIFIIAEKQNVIRKLNKKIVRTTAVQIGTSNSLNLLNEFYGNYKLDLERERSLEIDDE